MILIVSIDCAVITVESPPGTNGLGAATAKMLAARHPAKIYITGRNHAAAQQTIEDIKSNSGATETEVEWIRCDHASLTSVREAADQLLAKESRLDVLMANAGIMALPPGLVSESQISADFRRREKCLLPGRIIWQELEPTRRERLKSPSVEGICVVRWSFWIVWYTRLLAPASVFLGSLALTRSSSYKRQQTATSSILASIT